MSRRVRNPALALSSEVHLPDRPWTTLHEGLCALFPHVSASAWDERFARGRVRAADNRILAADAPYQPGLRVHYWREVPDEAPVGGEVEVLFADDDLIVADKPAGLPVAPTGRWVEQTLLRRLQRALGNPDLVPLHRLDRHTAGLVLLSARPASRDAYYALFRERRVTKTYHALAAPLPEHAFPLTRLSRLVPGEPFFRMQEVAGPANTETRIDVLERGDGAWRYLLSPVTGRKHQLRVHMAALGAPILGDPLYPVRRFVADAEVRLALLAQAVSFADPLSARRRAFTSRLSLPDPRDR